MDGTREELLFAMALEQPAGQHRAFLQAVCGDDLALCRRIELLLAAHENPDARLAEPATGALPGPPLNLPDGESAKRPNEAVGQTIGRYKLLEKVGEGGCGVVYVAEQTEPVRRRVALKVIKLGMDTDAVVARFEAERQALAMMDHPNIARVLDAGATDKGRPYFVMELVRGIRITDYCDQTNLSTVERLALFIKVCHAIQHAHQKGIIHRDIKPSNILVTLHDGEPVPKVIDFGIAKATEGRLTDATVYTQLHQFMGTPAYMSPEQAEMSGLDIDTRSDIYSLGVLLYELLAGSTPFDGRELISLGIDRMRRVIRETEPLRPSTRLASLTGEELTATAKRLSTDVPKLIHVLKGDLDWIVMKCLEKDRNRRYETANGLAGDLKRHLENEPVTARPPSMAYRFHKAIRRNKLAYSAVMAIALAILAGAILSYLQASRAWIAEALAKARVADAEQISEFLQQIFRSPDPAKDGRTTTVAESLDRAVNRLETDLADQPERRAKLQGTLAATYTSLGLNAPALKLREKVHSYWLAAAGPDATETLDAAAALTRSLWANGQSRVALPIIEDLLARTRQRYGPAHTNTIKLVVDYANIIDVLSGATEALKLREENLAAHRKIFGPEHIETLTAMGNLEVNYNKLGQKEKARPLQEEVVALSRKIFGPEHLQTLRHLGNLGVDYTADGRLPEAIQLLEGVVEKQRRVLGPEHPNTIHTLQSLATAYHQSGRTTEGLELREEVLNLTRKSLGPEHPHILYRMGVLANSYQAVGRTNEATKLLEETLALTRKIHGEEEPKFLRALASQAYTRFRMGNFEEAIRLGEECVQRSRTAIDTNSFEFIQRATWLGNFYHNAQRHQESIPLWREIVVLTQKNSGPEHTNTLACMRALAEACAGAQQFDEAVKVGEELLAVSQKFYAPEHSEVFWAIDSLAKIYSSAGKLDRAVQLRKEVVALRQKTRGPEDAATVEAIKAVADVYAEHGRWSEARVELLPLMEMKRLPDSSTIALMSLAALDVLLGERANYEAHCQVMLAHLASATNSEIANRIAKACLLLPLNAGERKPAIELADRGVRLGENSPFLPWYLLSQALGGHRSGDWSGAVSSAERALELSKGDPNPSRSAALHAILSMARHQSGHIQATRTSLAESTRLFDEQWPRVNEGKLGASWHDVLIAHLLIREATALIQTPASPSQSFVDPQ